MGQDETRVHQCFSKYRYVYVHIYIDEKHTTYIVFICIIKQENIIFIPDTGVGLGKPRDDIVASPLYPTVVVETPATPLEPLNGPALAVSSWL